MRSKVEGECGFPFFIAARPIVLDPFCASSVSS
jgi:hypothetical protein